MDALPARCLFRWEFPLQGVMTHQDRGYACVVDDPEAGTVAFAIADTCQACIARLSSHPRIKRLRRHVDV